MTSLYNCIPAALGPLAPELHGGSLVLLDDGSAEAIAAAAGMQLLSDMGAVSVGNLHSSSLPLDIAAAATLAGGRLTSLTIFLSKLLGPSQASLTAACRATMVYTSKVVVACAVSEAAHHDEAPSLYSASNYQDFSAALRHQLQPQKPLEIIIKHCPLFTIPLGEFAFVLPAASAAAAAATAAGRPLGYVSSLSAAEDSDDEDEEKASSHNARKIGEKAHGVAVLAHALANVAGALGVRPEAFCLGPAAIAVGKSLSFVASSDAAPAAFLLIDRGADLATPLLHKDILMQRAWELLPSCSRRGVGAEDGVGSPQINAPERERKGEISNGDTLFEPAHVYVLPPLSTAPPSTIPQQQEVEQHQQQGVAEKESMKKKKFLPGSLFHPEDPQTTSHLGFLLTRPGRDAAMFVRKWLREAARKENIPAAAMPRSKPGAVGAAELRALSAAIATSTSAARHTAPLLQLAEAAATALEEAPVGAWDLLGREERALMMSCADGPEPVCEQLVDLIAAAGRGGPLGLPHAVGLLLLAYQILPEHLPWYASGSDGGGRGTSNNGIPAFSAEHEVRIRSALADAVLGCSERWASSAEPEAATQRDAPWLPVPLLNRLVVAAEAEAEDADGGERRALHLEVRDATEELFSRLRELSAMRQAAQCSGGQRGSSGSGRGRDLSFPAGASAGTPGSSEESLLVRLAEAVADRREIGELKHASTSLAGLLKSGLGRFGLQRQPRPGDYPVVVMFVIGGISIAEIHEVLACVDAKTVASGAAAAAARQAGGGGSGVGGSEVGAGPAPPAKVLLGGTALLQPRDVVGHALGSL